MDQKIEVDQATAMTLELQRFDKMIAEGEAHVAELRKQRASLIYDTNVQIILSQKRNSVPGAAS
jgi:hypothetical protein